MCEYKYVEHLNTGRIRFMEGRLPQKLINNDYVYVQHNLHLY